MLNYGRVTVLIMALLVICMYSALAGQDQPSATQAPNTHQQVQGIRNSQLQTLIMAYQLINYGRSQKVPMALITAAEVISRIPMTVLDVKPTSKKNADQAGANTQASKQPQIKSNKPSDLLSEAMKMSGNNPAITMLVNSISESIAARQKTGAIVPLGARGGPQYFETCIGPDITDIYTIPFTGGQWAEVAVIGDGDTDLDLYISESDGTPTTSNTSKDDVCYCTWYCRSTDTYTVEVVNNGDDYNCYALETN